MKALHMIAFTLLVIGGVNWLLVAFNWNLVTLIFGAWPAVVMLIYILVGLSAILEAVTHGKNCRMCSSKM
jgi:uncharacterized membrane protein YuzA (DUF378 family)